MYLMTRFILKSFNQEFLLKTICWSKVPGICKSFSNNWEESLIYNRKSSVLSWIFNAIIIINLNCITERCLLLINIGWGIQIWSVHLVSKFLSDKCIEENEGTFAVKICIILIKVSIIFYNFLLFFSSWKLSAYSLKHYTWVQC